MNTKRLISASIFALISASAAQAADVMVPHQPARTIQSAVVVPNFTWTGFYFGGQAGGFSSKTDMGFVGKDKTIPLSKDWSPKLSGFQGGLYTGANIDLGDNFIFSIDTDLSWAGQKHTKTITLSGADNASVDNVVTRSRRSARSLSGQSARTTTAGTTTAGTTTAGTTTAGSSSAATAPAATAPAATAPAATAPVATPSAATPSAATPSAGNTPAPKKPAEAKPAATKPVAVKSEAVTKSEAGRSLASSRILLAPAPAPAAAPAASGVPSSGSAAGSADGARVVAHGHNGASNGGGHGAHPHGMSHGAGHGGATNPHASNSHAAHNVAGRSAQGTQAKDENGTSVYGIEQVKNEIAGLGLNQDGNVETVSHTLKQNWAGATRVRIGFAADRIMPYIAGGIAYTQLQDTVSISFKKQSEETISSKDLIDEKKTMIGYTIGGGVDFAMTDNVLLRAEYRYSDFGKKKFAKEKLEISYKTNDFRVGVAYKF
ncbi:Opacity protein and related surface antigens [Candidatus Bartonella washoeensis]|uniref:Porin n=1 Tax=Candidatus Bartonella washoeensis Sb944nv TaxID=1094563 RepID=J0Z1Z3_9HYPH|nr:outer membrane beta-barrel protein [Bartonella washoeensis]EJF81408.1 hypothetical protein MCQ_00106 [Bartonella washoeensis Sb944nv]SPU27350.1 Opacity protein and related surface antigens [Bartonella washoeensis]